MNALQIHVEFIIYPRRKNKDRVGIPLADIFTYEIHTLLPFIYRDI